MESIRIVTPPPRPDVQHLIVRDRQRATDRRIERELARIRAERRAAEPDDSDDLYEQARQLLNQFGTFEAAVAHLLGSFTNGHHPVANQRGLPQRPAIIEHGPASRILSVK